MARRLIERGHTVTIVCGSRKGKLNFEGTLSRKGYKYGTIDGINIIEIQIPHFNYANFIQRAIAFLRYGFRGDQTCALNSKLRSFICYLDTSHGKHSRYRYEMFRKKPFVFEVRDLWPELPKAMGVITNPIALSCDESVGMVLIQKSGCMYRTFSRVLWKELKKEADRAYRLP
jgi:hypothetical protein